MRADNVLDGERMKPYRSAQLLNRIHIRQACDVDPHVGGTSDLLDRLRCGERGPDLACIRTIAHALDGRRVCAGFRCQRSLRSAMFRTIPESRPMPALREKLPVAFGHDA